MIDWPSLLARIDVSGFPLPMKFRYENGYLITSFKPMGKDWIDCRPAFTRLHYSGLGGSQWLEMSEPEARLFIRREAQMAVLHELDECLRLDGRLINDPHVRVPYPAEGT